MVRPLPLALRPFVPVVAAWIARTVRVAQAQAVELDGGVREALAGHFSAPTLARARVVVGRPLPSPPVPTFGIARLQQFRSGDYAGLTLQNLIFVLPEHATDVGLFAHELVHVLQWARLGPSGFLRRYAAELLEHGYGAAPLERMAYAHEARLRAGEPYDLETEVQRELDGEVSRPRLARIR